MPSKLEVAFKCDDPEIELDLVLDNMVDCTNCGAEEDEVDRDELQALPNVGHSDELAGALEQAAAMALVRA